MLNPPLAPVLIWDKHRHFAPENKSSYQWFSIFAFLALQIPAYVAYKSVAYKKKRVTGEKGSLLLILMRQQPLLQLKEYHN